jgi:hypothetical protein
MLAGVASDLAYCDFRARNLDGYIDLTCLCMRVRENATASMPQHASELVHPENKDIFVLDIAVYPRTSYTYGPDHLGKRAH